MKRIQTPIKALFCALAFTGVATAIDFSDEQSVEGQVIVGNGGAGWTPVRPSDEPTILEKFLSAIGAA
ncbi:hypothetical protein [Thalassomonas actiniarum]|uniref:Uncharacterized protein n=1 Tax=Thalassomonas actiniarum TaxID=485447 RepID=A0AAF0BZE2_9GAMM|nr:hypothetical protein [Thalassomonas actiniarum]WDD97881.1 hypothetical protein SG35_021695 [Thalassomonas actiniarum]